jgi:uncharacterized membrane protein
MILILLLISVLAGLVIFADWLKQIADENGRTELPNKSVNTLQVSYARGEIDRASFKAAQKNFYNG